MQGIKVRLSKDAPVWFTAREYWEREMPRTAELLLDRDTAYADETLRAAQLAKANGLSHIGTAFPVTIWDALYSDM